MHGEFPRVQRAVDVDVDDAQGGLDGGFVGVYAFALLAILSTHQVEVVGGPPSSGHSVSPLALLMPALAMTMSQLFAGEFAIAASKTSTCWSQSAMLHFTNCAFLSWHVSGSYTEYFCEMGICDSRTKFLDKLLSTLLVQVRDRDVGTVK